MFNYKRGKDFPVSYMRDLFPHIDGIFNNPDLPPTLVKNSKEPNSLIFRYRIVDRLRFLVDCLEDGGQ